MLIKIWMEKTGSMIFLSHLELMKTLERSFKAGRVKMAHSQGFNPRPLMNFALPLAVGVEAKKMILELELSEDQVDFSEVWLPRGLKIIDYKEVERGPSLMSRVDRASYEIFGELQGLSRLESVEPLLYTKKNKRGRVSSRDARDYILDFKKIEGGYSLMLKAGSQANLKPADLLEAVLEDPDEVHSYDISLVDVFDKEGKSLW